MQCIFAFLQGNGNSQTLEGGEDKREIARPLGDLAAAKLTFFLQPRQRLVDHGEQLQNDG